MLHIVKQFISGLTMGVKLYNWPENWLSGWEQLDDNKNEVVISQEVKESTQAREVVSNTISELKDLYNEVEVSKLEAASFLVEQISDKELKNKDYNSPDVQKMQTILKMLWMNISVDWDFWDKTEELVKQLQKQLKLEESWVFNNALASKLSTVINNEINERKQILTASQVNEIGQSQENAELSDGIVEHQDTESWNHISTGMRNETWFQQGEMTREEAISHMKLTSLENLLRVHSAAEIVKAISEWTEKYEVVVRNENWDPELDDQGNEITNTRLNFNGLTGSYSQAEKWLEDKGYDSDGYFGGLEMNSIYTYAVEIMKNQETANGNSSEEKFKQLIDFDGNGFLTSDKNFYMWELQAAYLDQTETVWNYENLYKNLGLDQAQLENEMTTNYFTAQEKFEQRLSTYLQMGIKPGELFVEWGLEKAVNQLYQDTNEQLEVVKDHEAEVLFVKWAVKQALSNKLNWEFPDLERVSDAIALESVHAILGWAEWVAANFNISKFTNDLVRDLTVGVVNGKPGVMISRGFFEKQLDKYDISVSGGLLNVVIPIVTVSADVFKEKFPKADVVNGTWDDYKISVFASASTIGQAVGVQYTESSFETSTGIEKLWDELSKQLDEMIAVLAKDEDAQNPIQLTVDESGLTQAEVDAANKLYDNYFSVLQNIEQKVRWNKQEKPYFENAKQAIVNGYTDKLYRNLWDKVNFASVGAGVAFAADILPVPFVTASFENIVTHFEEQNHSNERERANTEKSMQVNIEEYKGFDAIVFDNNYNISIPEGYTLQANIDSGKLYIWGDIQSLRVHEHVTNSLVNRTIVINGWTLNSQGLYETSNEMADIANNVNIDKKQVYQQELLDAANNTQDIRDEINVLFNFDTLRSGDTPGAVVLQREIYNYVNWTSNKDITAIFDQFKGFVNNNMWTFSKKLGLESNLQTLQTTLNNFSSTNKNELLAILQSVNANFMEKKALQIGENDIVSMNETISKYDENNNRDRFFNKAFEEKYWKAFSSTITQARESWRSINWEASKYTFTPSEGNLAMTWVTLGVSWSWVMSYEWVYNIAQPEWWKAYVTLENHPDFINNLPKNFLINIQSQLNNLGVELLDLEEVKAFINKWWDERAVINYSLAFARMGECLNDAVILKGFSIQAPNKTVSSLTSTMNTQDETVKTFWVTLVDEVRQKDQLEEGRWETTPTEESNGDVDENWEATWTWDTTVDDWAGWDPNDTGETVISVEDAQEINRSAQGNIKDVVPNVVHISNDSWKTWKNMNDK